MEPALLASEAMDGEAQPAASERRPGRPQRTSGEMARTTPSPTMEPALLASEAFSHPTLP